MAEKDSTSLCLDLLALVEECEESKLRRAMQDFNAAVVSEFGNLGSYHKRLANACEEAKKAGQGPEVSAEVIEPRQDLAHAMKYTNQAMMILAAEAHGYKGKMSKEIKDIVAALPKVIKNERGTRMQSIAMAEAKLKAHQSLAQATKKNIMEIEEAMKKKKAEQADETRRALNLPIPGLNTTRSTPSGNDTAVEKPVEASVLAQEDSGLRASGGPKTVNGGTPSSVTPTSPAASKQIIEYPPPRAPIGSRAQLARQNKRERSPDHLSQLEDFVNKKNKGDKAATEGSSTLRATGLHGCAPVCNSCHIKKLRCDGKGTCVACFEAGIPCLYQVCRWGNVCRRRATCTTLHPDQREDGEKRAVRSSHRSV